MYISILSLTSALHGDGWSTPHPGRFTPGKGTRYPLYRRSRAGLDECGKFGPHQDLIPGLSSP